ncbi:MAG: hypothetical protein M3Q97_00815 [Bacteroidota bacterium]|nr:hypothetical protein [Bacteroidota bacterium]
MKYLPLKNTSTLLTLLFFAGLSFTGQAQSYNVKPGQNNGFGSYEDENDNVIRNHPYTIFNRNETFAVQLENVRAKIQNSLQMRGIYTVNIFSLRAYVSPSWLIDGKHKPPEGIDQAAVHAKNAAFVYLLGLDNNGNDIKGTQAHTDSKTDALRMLDEMNTVIRTGAKSWQWGSKNLMMYLQAYDMLMAIPNQNDPDITLTTTELENLTNIRLHLQAFAQNLYQHSNGLWSALWRRNNHSVMVASTLGMAAVVLNNCGHKRNRESWHPQEWANAAHCVINRSLWTARSGNVLSERGDNTAGYAEGPHYFNFAFENAIPFFVAFNNFIPGENRQTYSYNYLNQEVINYMLDLDYYTNLYNWYRDILLPNGDLPSNDNTHVRRQWPSTLGLLRNQEYNIRLPFKDGNNASLIVDYIVAAELPPDPGFQANLINILYRNTGVAVLKTPPTAPDQHYIQILAENGSSVNGAGHEEPDATSIIITAGDELLVITPDIWDGPGGLPLIRPNIII